MCQDAGVEHTVIDGFLASQACGGSGSASLNTAASLPVAPAGSVQGDAAGSMCLDSCFDEAAAAPQPAPAAKVGAQRGGKKASALDLLDMDMFGAAGSAVSQLGAELMDFTFDRNQPECAWAP